MLPPNVLFMKPMARCLVSLHLSLRFILSHLRGALTPYLYIHTHANTSIFDISHCSPPSRRSSTELPLDGQSLSSMLGTLPGLPFKLSLSSRHDTTLFPPQNPPLLSDLPSKFMMDIFISKQEAKVLVDATEGKTVQEWRDTYKMHDSGDIQLAERASCV